MSEFINNAEEIIGYVQQHKLTTYTDDKSGQVKPLIKLIVAKNGFMYPLSTAKFGDRPLFIRKGKVRQSLLPTGMHFKHGTGSFESAVQDYNRRLEAYVAESGQVQLLQHIIVSYYSTGIPKLNEAYPSGREGIENCLIDNKGKYFNRDVFQRADGIIVDIDDNVYPYHFNKLYRMVKLEFRVRNGKTIVSRRKLSESSGYIDTRFNKLPDIIENHNNKIINHAVQTLHTHIEYRDKVKDIIGFLEVTDVRNLSNDDYVNIYRTLDILNVKIRADLYSVAKGKKKSIYPLIQRLKRYLDTNAKAEDLIIQLGEVRPDRLGMTPIDPDLYTLTKHEPIIKNIKLI